MAQLMTVEGDVLDVDLMGDATGEYCVLSGDFEITGEDAEFLYGTVRWTHYAPPPGHMLHGFGFNLRLPKLPKINFRLPKLKLPPIKLKAPKLKLNLKAPAKMLSNLTKGVSRGISSGIKSISQNTQGVIKGIQKNIGQVSRGISKGYEHLGREVGKVAQQSVNLAMQNSPMGQAQQAMDLYSLFAQQPAAMPEEQYYQDPGYYEEPAYAEEAGYYEDPGVYPADSGGVIAADPFAADNPLAMADQFVDPYGGVMPEIDPTLTSNEDSGKKKLLIYGALAVGGIFLLSQAGGSQPRTRRRRKS